MSDKSKSFITTDDFCTQLNQLFSCEEMKTEKVKRNERQLNENSLQSNSNVMSFTPLSEKNANCIEIWNGFNSQLNKPSDTSWTNHNLNALEESTTKRPIIKSYSVTPTLSSAPTLASHCSNFWYDNWRDGNQDSNLLKKQVRFETPSNNWRKDLKGVKSSRDGIDADKEELSDDSIENFGSNLNFGSSLRVLNGLERVREISEHLEQRLPSVPLPSLASTRNPIVNALMPVLRHSESELRYGYKELTKNVENICSNLNSVFNDPIWGSELMPQIVAGTQESVIQIAQKLRNVAKKVEASYTWSGQLPRRVRTKNPIYSCKVFLGGIPYDLTDSDLHCTFAQFGHIQIQWAGKEVKSAIDGATANKAGYVYIIFESYDNVASLLNACTISYRDVETGCRWYYSVSSRRQKGKEVQVIPFDIGDRFYMKGSFCGQMEHSRTVFVGALHGMLTADGLAKVMDDLFGGVIFAGLDTDKHKYPLGSGRVSFDNQESYLKAVSAAFVEVKSARFKKKIQIDPYIENESVCAVCKLPQQSPIFCRDLKCFRYFCRNCWDQHHSEAETHNHRPIIKNKPPV